MSGKSSKQYLFEVQLNWLAGTRGVLSAMGAEGTVHVGTSPEFGGSGKPWSPEHLFLSSVSSCFMSTYIVFAKKMNFEIADFECAATGQAEVVDGKYRFTFIHLYPKAYTKNIADKETVLMAMEKAKKYCLVSNSLNAEIIYHMEVEVKEDTEKINSKKRVPVKQE